MSDNRPLDAAHATDYHGLSYAVNLAYGRRHNASLLFVHTPCVDDEFRYNKSDAGSVRGFD